jgi:hypothetical protein
MFLFTSFIICVAALVQALPLTKREVVSPHITSPADVTIWTTGNNELVTWYGAPNGRQFAHVSRTEL